MSTVRIPAEGEFGMDAVMIAFGRAMYSAQSLERYVWMALGVSRVLDGKFESLRNAAEATESSYTMTMGTLLNELTPLLNGPLLVARLDACLKARNSLAHHFFEEHQSDELSSEGRARMIAEAEGCIEHFRDAEASLHAAIKQKLDEIVKNPDDYVDGLASDMKRSLGDS